MKLRPIESKDLEAIVKLFKDTVHHVNLKDYTSEQLFVWAPSHAHHSHVRWQSLLTNIAYLVEINGVIVGFADMTNDGYLDRLFVHKDYQGQGIASKLIKKLESEMIKKGVEKITTEASITAKPFFQKRGYCILKEQNNQYPGGVNLKNYLMEKTIHHPQIKIDLLKYHPDVIPALATIWQQVLGSIWAPDVSIDKVKQRFEEHLNDNDLPLTLVAFLDNKPVGMCSLRKNDGILDNLSPWLGSLVVHPDYQRLGIAVKLIDAIKTKAKNMGFPQLYLFTFDPTLPNYYAKLGWENMGIKKFKGKDVTVMKIKL